MLMLSLSIGEAYEDGYGVLEDKMKAYAWFNIAQANGKHGAKGHKAGVAIGMTPMNITESQKLSQEMVKANPKLLGD